MELPILCQVNELKVLDLSHNQLFGELPSCIWSLRYLQFLDLSSNTLVGEVTTMMTNSMSSVSSLHLSNNNFTGSFSAMLKNFKNLTILDLANNKISGTIPPWIRETNPLLRILILRSNMLHGTIPWQLSQLSYLHLLDLAENNFTGSIPNSFANMSSMCQPIKETYIDNGLGEIIHSYHDEVDIVWKRRDYNFQSAVDSMIAIDLSRNSLSGQIPSQLTNLRGLRSLNMSGNYLSGGEIPTGYQLRTLDDASIYSNNPGLCGFPLNTTCNNSIPRSNIHGQEYETLSLCYWVIAGFVFGFWLWFGALFLCKSWRFAFFNCVDVTQYGSVKKIKQREEDSSSHLAHLGVSELY
ncbi:receptor-like protein EIX1 isoform X1 [Panicum virgatum]|uniref:receptor-like protein EIX1 isoform X1 n=1 Tax=Panicum virgatum TaxID=38727 RepID=UPI0019D64F82|nr:receptor-like protein EIX1 isoform X1 [Panicum virgatum]